MALRRDGTLLSVSVKVSEWNGRPFKLSACRRAEHTLLRHANQYRRCFTFMLLRIESFRRVLMSVDGRAHELTIFFRMPARSFLRKT